jgi:hypothetical protein
LSFTRFAIGGVNPSNGLFHFIKLNVALPTLSILCRYFYSELPVHTGGGYLVIGVFEVAIYLVLEKLVGSTTLVFSTLIAVALCGYPQ